MLAGQAICSQRCQSGTEAMPGEPDLFMFTADGFLDPPPDFVQGIEKTAMHLSPMVTLRIRRRKNVRVGQDVIQFIGLSAAKADHFPFVSMRYETLGSLLVKTDALRLAETPCAE